MRPAIVIFILAVLFMAGGLQDLPKNLPPPLKDDPEDDWGAGKSRNDSDPKP